MLEKYILQYLNRKTDTLPSFEKHLQNSRVLFRTRLLILSFRRILLGLQKFKSTQRLLDVTAMLSAGPVFRAASSRRTDK
ncbi:MAG: hypothetical protein JWM11_7000 [Planctomycetaceae bacterium]|nr:hypothetical protein [Planctomycetaceae bacterium]